MKNIIFIPNIDLGNGRNKSYEYSVNSWKKFCDKHDCDLILLEELITSIEFMPVVWQRYFALQLLENDNIKYDQVLISDADTIVHPDCPNIFEDTKGNYSAVMNDGDYEWVNRSISQYGPKFFNNDKFDTHRYVNGGLQIFNESHKEYLDGLIDWYKSNSNELLKVFGKWNSCDQTCINFYRESQDLEMTLLPVCYNLQDLSRKNLLYYHPQQWWSDELHFLKNGWIYHFNAIPQNQMGRDANYWIKRTYNELYK